MGLRQALHRGVAHSVRARGALPSTRPCTCPGCRPVALASEGRRGPLEINHGMAEMGKLDRGLEGKVRKLPRKLDKKTF